MNSASTLLRPALPGDIDAFGDQLFGQSTAAELGADQNTDPADVALPAAQLLVQSARHPRSRY